jgi:hypothetical protein
MERQSERRGIVVARHLPTRKRAQQMLTAFRIESHCYSAPEEIPSTSAAIALIDLDVAPDRTAKELVADVGGRAKTALKVAIAGGDAQRRLLEALCDGGADHVIAKHGAETPEQPLEGPDPTALFHAVARARLGHLAPERSLMHDALTMTRFLRDKAEIAGAVHDLSEAAATLQLSRSERLQAVAEELLMNALVDAPQKAGAAAPEEVALHWGCDGQTLVLWVTDSFGSLTRSAICDRLRLLVHDNRLEPTPTNYGAGLGLALVYHHANQVFFQIRPGSFTLVGCTFHIAGSNRAAQERGTAVHIELLPEAQ